MPPFKVRRARKINKKLQRAAIVKGFVIIPVYTNTNMYLWDVDLSKFKICNYAYEAYEARNPDDIVYDDIKDSKPRLAKAYTKEFPGISEHRFKKMSFK